MLLRITKYSRLVYPQKSLLSAKRLKFSLRAVATARLHRRWFQLLAQPHLDDVVRYDPRLLARLQKPCLHAGLAPQERLEMLSFHFRRFAQWPERMRVACYSPGGHPLVRFEDEGRRHALAVEHVPGLSREGELSLVWRCDDTTVAMATFVFCPWHGGGVGLLVGGLQGARNAHGLELFRELTKTMHGLRPMSFMVHALRGLARAWGLEGVLAVSEAGHATTTERSRQKGKRQFDYDTIWQEHGGVVRDRWLHELSLATERRSLEDVPSRKRALYRRRYALLESLETLLAQVPG